MSSLSLFEIACAWAAWIAFMWWIYTVVPNQTIVMLDLNHVLVRRVWSPDEVDPNATRRVNKHNVYVRPGAKEFVRRLKLEWNEVGVWTAGRRENVFSILEDVGLDPDSTLLLTQEDCTAVPREGTHPLFVKDMSTNGGLWYRKALLIDDSIMKVRARDWGYAVIVEPWDENKAGTSFEVMHEMLMEHPVKKFIRNAFVYYRHRII